MNIISIFLRNLSEWRTSFVVVEVRTVLGFFFLFFPRRGPISELALERIEVIPSRCIVQSKRNYEAAVKTSNIASH